MLIKEIYNKQVWENLIKNYSPSAFFQSFNWGEIIKKRGGNLRRIGVYNNSELVATAQIETVRAKRGAFLHIRHGPIFKNLNSEIFRLLINYLKTLARKEKTLFIRISPLIDNSIENKSLLKDFSFIPSPIHAMDGEYCWVLDLKRSPDEVLSNMRKTTRYLIKKAKSMGVVIKISKDLKDIDDFLSLYEITAKRHGFVEHKGIKEEFEILSKDDQVEVFKGYYQSRLLACALIVFYNHQAIYHHSASIEQKIPVNYLLQWEAILEAKKRNKKIYNFWGIAPEGKKRHPWYGLTAFKKGFGGKEKEYLHAYDLPLSSFYCATFLVESFRRVIKGY